jgi:hypothetical protein
MRQQRVESRGRQEHVRHPVLRDVFEHGLGIECCKPSFARQRQRQMMGRERPH